jgi:DNA-directed RNA polymerase subunit RPC12/RpoP
LTKKLSIVPIEIIFGLLGSGGIGGTIYYGLRGNGVLMAFLFISLFSWLSFLAILMNYKSNICEKCKKTFAFEEVGDGKVISKSPDGRIKVIRKYRCRGCGKEFFTSGWEDIEKNKKFL